MYHDLSLLSLLILLSSSLLPVLGVGRSQLDLLKGVGSSSSQEELDGVSAKIWGLYINHLTNLLSLFQTIVADHRGNLCACNYSVTESCSYFKISTNHFTTNMHIYCGMPGSPCLSKIGPVFVPFSFLVAH